MGADTRNEQWHVADDFTHLGDFVGEGGADDEGALAAGVPFVCDFVCDDLVQWFSIHIEKL